LPFRLGAFHFVITEGYYDEDIIKYLLKWLRLPCVIYLLDRAATIW
jgi:hypothetical protein